MSFARTWRDNETRGLRGLGVLVVAGMLAVLALATMVMVLWPQSPDVPQVFRADAGPVGSFEAGMPELFAATKDVSVWIVRQDDASFLAFSVKDPRNACALRWRPEFPFDGQQGWFADPCHGSLYGLDGSRAFGPSPRDLFRFDVEVRQGRVIVLVEKDAQPPPLVTTPYSLE